MMNKAITISIIILLIVIATVTVAVIIFAPKQSVQSKNSLGTLPDLILKDYTGNEIRLHDYIGTPLVINSWAVWCPFCVDELHAFAEVQKKFGTQVKFIAVNRAEPLETARTFTDKSGITSDLIFLLDPKDSFYHSIGGFAMPETIFVDKQGIIREHKRGPMKTPEIISKVNNLLNL